MIDLTKCLSLLKNSVVLQTNSDNKSVVLPTNVFKQLKLVVEWNNENTLKNMVGYNIAAITSIKPKLNSYLSVDEYLDSQKKMELMNQFKGVQWQAVETDSKFIEAQATSGTQKNNFIVRGFDGKQVNKLLIQLQPTQLDTWRTGTTNNDMTNQGSIALYNGKFNVVVNGKQLLTRDGFTNDMTRLSELTDLYGEMNLKPGDNLTSLSNIENINTNNTSGDLDWTSMIINDRINELQVNIERETVNGAANNKINQRLKANIFGMVDKSIVMRTDGRYNVVYN